jgi:hypothetical protein
MHYGRKQTCSWNSRWALHDALCKEIEMSMKGINTLKVSTLDQKWWLVTNMIMYNEFKFTCGNLVATLNSSKKYLECTWQLFVTQSLFYIKINFDPIVILKRIEYIQCTYYI